MGTSLILFHGALFKPSSANFTVRCTSLGKGKLINHININFFKIRTITAVLMTENLLQNFQDSSGECKHILSLYSIVLLKTTSGRILADSDRLPVVIPMWLSGKYFPRISMS